MFSSTEPEAGERITLRGRAGARYPVTACRIADAGAAHDPDHPDHPVKSGDTGAAGAGDDADRPMAAAVRVEVEMPPSAVTGLAHGRLFHLVDGAVPATAAWDPAAPVSVQLRPGALAVTGLPAPGEPGLAGWFGSDPARSRCESWFATRVAQPLAATPWRAETLWNYVDPRTSLPAGSAASRTRATQVAAGGADSPSGPDAVAAVQGALAFVRAQHPELADDRRALDRWVDTLVGRTAPDVHDALARLHALLVDAGSEPAMFEDGTGMHIAVQGRSGRWPGLVMASEGGALVFYCIHPVPVAPDRIDAAYQAIGRWNSNRLIGGLDLDAASGRIVFRLPLLLDDRPPGAPLLRRALDCCLDAMDGAAPMLAEWA